MNEEADLPLADRMCIVTREVKDEAELIRFVRSPDGMVVPDLARKLPGSVMTNTAPPSGRLPALTCPPCALAIAETTDKPNPAPGSCFACLPR